MYRTLELLEELGIVRHTHFHGDRAQYQRTDEPAHQHLVCTTCGRDRELDLSVLQPLDQELRRRYGFEADLTHTAISACVARAHPIQVAGTSDDLKQLRKSGVGDPPARPRLRPFIDRYIGYRLVDSSRAFTVGCPRDT